MENKITIAMPLSELPYFYEKEETVKILNENGIHTISEIVTFTYAQLAGLGIKPLSLSYLIGLLEINSIYIRKESKGEQAPHLTSELWERRRYEVAKEIFMKKLDTCFYSTKEKSRAKEIEMSIEIATQFIERLKSASECDMENGTWN